MLHELKQGPVLTKIALQAAKLKRAVPKKLAEGAYLRPWLTIFYNAFLDLKADRNWEWGPITWTARTLWAQKVGLDDYATRLLHTHVGALDLAFLQWKHDNQPKEGSGKPVRGTRHGKPA